MILDSSFFKISKIITMFFLSYFLFFPKNNSKLIEFRKTKIIRSDVKLHHIKAENNTRCSTGGFESCFVKRGMGR
jgi:hypothetical protein